MEGAPLENRPVPSSKFTRDDALAEIGAIDNSKQNFRLETFILQRSKIGAKLVRKFDKTCVNALTCVNAQN